MADTPIGSIVAFAGPRNTVPPGWLVCNGKPLDRTKPENTALFSAIGTTWGGDGANLFHLPDLRGLFLRGVCEGSGNDPEAADRGPSSPESPNSGSKGNNVGSMQGDMVGRHTHPVNGGTFNLGYRHPSDKLEGGGDRDWWYPDAVHTVSVAEGGGSETRPKNAYVFWIIRSR